MVDFKPLVGKETNMVKLGGIKTIIMNGASFMVRFFEIQNV